LLKTKTEPQFERPVESLSTPIFAAFQGSNRCQFSALFPVSAVRSAEGRNGLVLLLAAECRLLNAFFSKTFHTTAFPRLERNDLIYHLFAFEVNRGIGL
jgi:hypothetical protein